MSSGGECLVARSVPVTGDDVGGQKAADALADKLLQMSVSSNDTDKNKSADKSKTDRISPKDFVALQSFRSSALAKKTNTTSRFGGRAGPELFADLLNKGDGKRSSSSYKIKQKDADKTGKIKSEAVEDDKKVEEDNKVDDDLLSRGPIRIGTHNGFAHHPYAPPAPQQLPTENSLYSGASGWGIGYSPDTYGCMSDSSSTPDSVFTPGSVMTADCDSVRPLRKPFTDNNITSDDLNRLLNVNELPDALSDFILKYSRRYSAEKNTTQNDSGTESRSSSAGLSQDSPREDGSAKNRPASNSNASSNDDSGIDSPMSAGGASNNRSPGTPSKTKVLGTQSIAPRPLDIDRPAKTRLRSLIGEEQMAEAWAWACKCAALCPGALHYRDNDGDSLLHIVVWHKDLAKTYAMVEQLLKSDYQSSPKPYDYPNRVCETPLFLAVEKRCLELVAYLLEAGAYPSVQTRRPEMDAPLHHASSRGMTEIVSALVAAPGVNFNQINGLGLTPLLCAVKNHGVIEEESQCLVNNKPTIRALLRAGADAQIPDASSGKTVIHYAVDRMDPELVEIFKASLSEEAMRQLVNTADFNRETPAQIVHAGNYLHGSTMQHRLQAEEELRMKMLQTLQACGAYL